MELIFGIWGTVWGTLMISGWMSREKEFAVRNGLLKKSGDEDDDNFVERPQFIGSYQRSIITDNMNA
jgi:hypothetical protein